MKMLIPVLVLVTSSIVVGQRPSFAGSRPIGFPETPNRTTTTPDPLGNRFGDGTPERLPIEANGDRDLIDRLSKLPVDKQPFWFINWQAYEQHRKNPQTFPQRPNPFVDPIPVNSNSGSVNNGFSTPSPAFGTETTVLFNRFGPTTGPSQLNNLNSNSDFNSGSNVYPNSNANFNSNVYPNGNNADYNIYTTANNVYYNANPTANPNSNVHTKSNVNSNNYPTGSNSNVFQSSNSNSQSNVGTIKNGVWNFQTTQKYQWNTSFMSTNVGTTNLNKYPEYYPRTDTYPQRAGLF